MSRERSNFDGGWLFHKGELGTIVPRHTALTGTCGGPSNTTIEEGLKLITPAVIQSLFGDDGSFRVFKIQPTLQGNWQQVALPHDWRLKLPDEPAEVKQLDWSLGNDRDGYQPNGVAWYRKIFTLAIEDQGKRIFIEFDGIMRDAMLWLNGSYLGTHYSGYTGFCFDVTDYLRYGDEGLNVLLVRTDVGTKEGWWYEGGGIYRHVWLIKTDPLHIVRHGVFITFGEITEQKALCHIETTYRNDGSHDLSFVVTQTILDPSGQKIVSATCPCEISFCSSGTLTQILEVSTPHLWTLEMPNLYSLITTISYADTQIDEQCTTFGIRTIKYTRGGLLLNGEQVEIKGVCAHQDFAGVGIALPERLIEYKIELLKSMGCNAYRSSHYPPTPELLDICDHIGILVLDENRHLEVNPDGIAELTDLILRDRNHPCVLMWCLENEELIAAQPEGKRLLTRLVDLTHRLDPTRDVTVAGMMAKSDYAYMSIPDVAGFNYDEGEGPRLFETYPHFRMMETESVSFACTRGIYKNNLVAGMCSSYNHGNYFEMLKDARADQGSKDEASQKKLHEKVSPNNLDYAWNHYRENPGLGGIFMWTGFDYRGNWQTVTSQYGAMDYCGFPKDAFYYWKSCWIDEPLVHVLPHWNWKVGEQVEVNVYTNGDEVELFLNGESLGKSPTRKGQILVKHIPYVPGELKAITWRNGQTVAECVRQTTGQAAKLQLVPDRTQLRADGQDLSIIRVEVIDAEGRIVPTADNRIEFIVMGVGSLLGVGNGNPVDYNSDKASVRHAFNGLALVLVQSSKQAGRVTVRVNSEGLESAEAILVLTGSSEW